MRGEQGEREVREERKGKEKEKVGSNEGREKTGMRKNGRKGKRRDEKTEWKNVTTIGKKNGGINRKVI